MRDKNRRNRLPLSSRDSFLLVISSTFFLIPCALAFAYKLQLHCVTSFVTSLISINYWIYAIHGWRRKADLIVSKISFAIYFITGCLYVRNPLLLAIGWSTAGIICYAYFQSHSAWEKDHNYWIYYHMLFHFSVAITKTVVILGSYYAF